MSTEASTFPTTLPNSGQDSWDRQRSVLQRLSRLFSVFGYQKLELPILGPAELFLRKSGGELASQMYSFADAGGSQVSLRPEFTAPIMRHYLDCAGQASLPVRWQYAGPVFRYSGAGLSTALGGGQFTQIGAELIGSGTVLADAELLGMAARVPSELGLKDWRLRIGDLAVLHGLLDVAGLSERSRSFIVSQIPNLAQGAVGIEAALERAEQLHLVGPGPEGDDLGLALSGLDDDQARKVLQGFLGWKTGDAQGGTYQQIGRLPGAPLAPNPDASVPDASTPGPPEDGGSGEEREIWGDFGRRDPSEIVDRLLRKIRGSDDRANLRRGMELVAQLVDIKGPPAAALEIAERLLQRAGANMAALKRLGELVELLRGPDDSGTPRIGSDNLELDFGLARGLAYYNGIVFEVRHSSLSGPLGGGGRYDDLARALGSKETVPALGFAYNLEALLHILGMDNSPEDSPAGLPRVLVAAADRQSFGAATDKLEELGQAGYSAEMDLEGRSVEEALSHARQRGMEQLVWVSADGKAVTHRVD
ncbi:MAG: ATP phosphoribosyltransferase regulatory subunit [Chloroflexi bacterium]|nr:ATP phosphoribosyltransferase regulatory subunit [Chloroflexota bacterium]